MPALKLFGRKWLAASDDLVYPGLFELFIRVAWLILIGIACIRYYGNTWNCRLGGEAVRTYLLGEVVMLGIITLLILVIIKHSAKGAIMDTHARRYVEPLLTVKILLLLPEIGWNILGSLWIFGQNIDCDPEYYSITVVKALVFFDWILIGLSIFGLALVFDPIGSLEKRQLENSVEHSKVSRIWLRRFRFLFWMRKDESASETFQHVAGLLTALFRGTDLVPSDVMAGSILLRVRQKRETHELRRLNLIMRPKCSSDASEIFSDTPSWMSLEAAHHMMQLAIASYGWLFVMYQHACTGCFRVIPGLTCCACFRRKRNIILDDNCCLCYLSGIKYLSNISEEDIIFASFRNHLCEIPFCIFADHKSASIVVAIRGSFSVRDIITDATAASELFECPGIPPNSMAHKGMVVGVKIILRLLEKYKILERAFVMYPNYHLVITGHSLGAGLAILLGLLVRPRYPNVRVFAFSTPAAVLSREAARITEEFVLSIGLEDDFIMRLSVESIENLRTSLLTILRVCRLPKYRVVLNGFGYAMFGIPERDLVKTWANCNVIHTIPVQSPLLSEPGITSNTENKIIERDITRRRYSRVKLFNGGRILQIRRCKLDKTEGKSKKKLEKKRKYEMRWAQPEEFTKISVMPRMLLDHLPENVETALATLIEQQNDIPYYFDP